MLAQEDSSHVCKLPREPFLSHSEQLIQYLLDRCPVQTPRVLELGCGPQSPLVPILYKRWPDLVLNQMDALPEVVEQAAKWNSKGTVVRMFLTDMSPIPTSSLDLVIAMSVFDQNPEAWSPQIAKEIHRVLKPGGRVVYIHNEELNLPATADSFVNRSLSQLLLPSPQWTVENDVDYCSASRLDVEKALASNDQKLAPVYWYLRGIYPTLYGEVRTPDASGKITVPFLRECGPVVTLRIRQAVAYLHEHFQVELKHHSTASLLRTVLEENLFSAGQQFEKEVSSVFELRSSQSWTDFFAERPTPQYFVRGLTRFGYTSRSQPAIRSDYDQSLNTNPTARENETMFIAYQYGFVARKI